jgi:hypothetical protein
MFQCFTQILLAGKCAIHVSLVTGDILYARCNRRIFVCEDHLASMRCSA